VVEVLHLDEERAGRLAVGALELHERMFVPVSPAAAVDVA
jgi:hypothetical protein